MRWLRFGAVGVGVVLWASCGTGTGNSTGGNGLHSTGGSSGTAAAGTGGGSSGSAGTGGTGNDASGGQSGASTGGTGTGGTGTGGTGTGGVGGVGGVGGAPADASDDITFVYDAGGGAGGVTQDSACATATVTQKLEKKPADIIWAVDSSGSMNLEAGWTQANMAPFSTKITGAGIDVHVVLISDDSTHGNGICVPAPLGSGSCPNDTNLPNYLHLPVTVDSNDALDMMVQEYPQYSSMLRVDSTKTFAVVTDDNATTGPYNSAAAFIAWANSVDPTKLSPGTWHFDGIFASAAPYVPGPCFLISAAQGVVYQNLVQQTGGISGDLCSQNFGPVFQQLATSVVTGAGITCDLPMPTTDAGVIDPLQVNLQFLAGNGTPPQSLGRVGDASQCTNGGWYYDNPASPTKITICPSTCSVAKSYPNASVSVLLGCLGA